MRWQYESVCHPQRPVTGHRVMPKMCVNKCVPVCAGRRCLCVNRGTVLTKQSLKNINIQSFTIILFVLSGLIFSSLFKLLGFKLGGFNVIYVTNEENTSCFPSDSVLSSLTGSQWQENTSDGCWLI